MSETLHGNWLLQVVQKNAAFSQRFRIAGSDSSDGVYLGVVPTSVAVSGGSWTVSLEWNDNAGSGWQRSAVRKSVEYTVPDGLVFLLGADDNEEGWRDFDFDDMVLRCTSLDPEVNPMVPTSNPYDFTITRDMLKKDPNQNHPPKRRGASKRVRKAAAKKQL